MDDLELEGEVLEKTLDQLEIINKWLGGFGVIQSGFKYLLKQKLPDTQRPIKIISLGCGGGDNLRRLARWLRKKQVAAELTGVDANAWAVRYATEKSIDYPEIVYKKADCVQTDFFTSNYDIILCSLFLHHLDEETLKAYLPLLVKHAEVGVIINDLHRHWLAYYLFRIITFVFCASPMVRHDGSVSVLRGFTRKELQSILACNQLSRYHLKWKWAFRWRLII